MLFLSLTSLSFADKPIYAGPLKASRGSRPGLQANNCGGVLQANNESSYFSRSHLS